MNKPSVYVVILNYNHLEDLKETIASFILQDYGNFKIIVSDNGSTDASIKWLKNNHPNIVVLENKTNLGWAEGNNVGIRYALKKNANFILLANNDLCFNKPDIISSLLLAFDKFHKLGIIGPSENSYFDQSQIVNQGWIMFPKVKESFNKYRNEYNACDKPENYKIIDNVSGSFMIIKRNVFGDVGEMDSKLFLYAEDADFSIRAWKKGWVSLVDKNVTVLHKISATSGINSPLQLYYKTRNLIYLVRKHKDAQSSHSFFIRKYYIDFIKQSVKIFVFKEYAGNRVKKIIAHFTGLIHGAVLKKMNKYY